VLLLAVPNKGICIMKGDSEITYDLDLGSSGKLEQMELSQTIQSGWVGMSTDQSQFTKFSVAQDVPDAGVSEDVLIFNDPFIAKEKSRSDQKFSKIDRSIERVLHFEPTGEQLALNQQVMHLVDGINHISEDQDPELVFADYSSKANGMVQQFGGPAEVIKAVNLKLADLQTKDFLTPEFRRAASAIEAVEEDGAIKLRQKSYF